MNSRLNWMVSLAGLLAVAVGAWSTEISEMETGQLLMEKDATYAPEPVKRPRQQQPQRTQRQHREVRFQLPEIRQGRPVNSAPAIRSSPQSQQHQSFRRGPSARTQRQHQQQVQTRSQRPRQHRQQYVEEAPLRMARRSSPHAPASRRQEQEQVQLARERQQRRAERYAQRYVPEEPEYEGEYVGEYGVYQEYEDEYEEYDPPAPPRSTRIRVQNQSARHRSTKPQRQPSRQRPRQHGREVNDYADQEPRARRAHRAQPGDDREVQRAHRMVQHYEEELEPEEDYQPRRRPNRHMRQQQAEESYQADHGYTGGGNMPGPVDRRFRRQKQPAQQGPTIRNEQQVLEEAMRLLQQGGMGQGQREGVSEVLEEYNPDMDHDGHAQGGYLEVEEEAHIEHKRPHHRDRAALVEQEPRRRQPDGPAQGSPPRTKIELPQERIRTPRRPEPVEEDYDDESVGMDGIFVPFPTWMDYFNDVEDKSSGDRVFHCPSGPVRPISEAKDIISTLAADQLGAVETIAKRNPATQRQF